MMIIRVAIVVIVIAIAGCAAAEEATTDPRDEIVYGVLSQFWGNARDSRGQLIQPASEADRTIVPVPMPIAYRALEAGEVSGAAEWCRLEWEPHYFSLTKSARSQGMTDTQVAFISVLHGAAQGAFIRSAHDTSCSDLARAESETRLRDSTKLELQQRP